MSTGTAPVPQLKVKSCKLKNDWKMIVYVFEVYPESFTKNEGGFITTKTIFSEKISKNNFIQNLSKNLNIAFILIKNWLSVCYIHFSETRTWKICGKFMKIFHYHFQNSHLWIWAILHAFSVHVHFFRPPPSAVSVYMLKYTKWALNSFKTQLNQ